MKKAFLYNRRNKKKRRQETSKYLRKNEINKGNEKENYREKALFNGDSKKKLRKRINKIKITQTFRIF